MAKANKPKADAAQYEAPKAGHHFEVGGSKYQYSLAKFIVPGLGIITALEAATDDTKYNELGGITINEYMVSIKAGAIEEA